MNIPNVEFIGKRVSSIELIKHSKLVSTITGTAGWEAILIGKPDKMYILYLVVLLFINFMFHLLLIYGLFW